MCVCFTFVFCVVLFVSESWFSCIFLLFAWNLLGIYNNIIVLYSIGIYSTVKISDFVFACVCVLFQCVILVCL